MLKGLNKGPNLQCCGVFPQECYGWVQPDLGTWDVCYSKTGNVYTWAQDDVNVANCLINLHYTQDDACISVAGSECEQYAKGSMIINSWVGASAYRFNADDSDTLQAASTAFLGTKFSTTSYEASGGEVTFSRVGQNVYQSAVTIRFAGDESC